MTKKHFIELATATRFILREMTAQNRILEGGAARTPNEIADARTQAHQEILLKTLADFCETQNPRFDRARWIAYVLGEGSAL